MADSKDMILLDSSVIIDFLRVKDKTKTWFYKLNSESQPLGISIISLTELYAGKSTWEKPAAKIEIDIIISGLQIISLTHDISISAGKLRADFNINALDAIVAQTAITSNSPLATLNSKHFKNIPHLKLLFQK